MADMTRKHSKNSENLKKMIYQVNDGIIRGFSVVAMVLGMMAYHFGPGALLMYMANVIHRKIFRIKRYFGSKIKNKSCKKYIGKM